VKKLIVDLKDHSDFTAAWLADAICNSSLKGVDTNVAKAAELMADAKTILSGADPDGEINQTKLNRLASRIEMHENQEKAFQATLDATAAVWVTLTGKKAWVPYSGGNVTPKNATATNAFFADRIAK
jgi:hypothetical protein